MKCVDCIHHKIKLVNTINTSTNTIYQVLHVCEIFGTNYTILDIYSENNCEIFEPIKGEDE